MVFIRSEANSSNRLIRGTCFINSIMVHAIIDTGAMHSFVFVDYAERLGFKLSVIIESMVIYTPANVSGTTSWVCLNCTLTIYGKSFGMNLVYLLLNQIDIILGMN